MNHLIFSWWREEEKLKAYFFLILLIIFCLMDVASNVGFNLWQKNFFNALEQKKQNVLLNEMIYFIPLWFFELFSSCGNRFIKGYISLHWREYLTKKILGFYFSEKNYYTIKIDFKNIDNSNQRIAEDIKRVTKNLVDLASVFFKDGLNIVTFSSILYSLSASLNFEFYNIKIKGFLLYAAFLYAGIAILATFILGRPLVHLDQDQENKEANLRYLLMQVNEHAENLEEKNRDIVIKESILESFSAIKINYIKILIRRIYLNGLRSIHGQLYKFVPLLIVSPFYFEGIISLGILIQTRGMFYEVYRSVSSVAYKFEEIASTVASLNRLNEFNKALRKSVC